MEGVYIGNDEVTATKYALEKKEGITDTGSSCIVGPTEEVLAIIEMLVLHLSYYADHVNWKYMFYCSEIPNLPNLNILFGGYWFEVRPVDYAVVIGEATYPDGTVSETLCAFCLMNSSDDKWILGDSFMRGWYVIHEYSNAR